MPIIHKVTGTVGDTEKTVHVLYELVSDGSHEFPEDFDINQAIHDAALQYALSRQGEDENVTPMTYLDFVLNAPMECCTANGFQKWTVESSAEPVRGNKFCFAPREVTWSRNREKIEQQKKAVFDEAFNEFGRQLGALQQETSAISDWTLPQITQQMLLWSRECVEKANTQNGCFLYPDVGTFVSEKLEPLGNGTRLEPPEVKPAKKRGRRAKK